MKNNNSENEEQKKNNKEEKEYEDCFEGELFYGNNQNIYNIFQKLNNEDKLLIAYNNNIETISQSDDKLNFEKVLNTICKIHPESIIYLFDYDLSLTKHNLLINDKIGQIDFNPVIIRKFLPDISEQENIEFYAKLSGQSKEEIEANKKELYTAFGLEKVAKKQASKLSGGWQRKLSIALALVTKPKVLFLDEPTLGLDVIARRELWNTIRKLKNKMTIILTTHYMEEAEALSDRIGIMKDGKLLFVGTKDELFEKENTNNIEEAFIRIVSGGNSNG